MPTTETTLRVRYAETDAQGVVHHANYAVWFEEGRSDYLRQKGLNYRDFERDGYFVVVVGLETRFRSPAFYEDELQLETSLENARGKLLVFTYRLLREGVELATGKTTHLIIDRERRQVRLPEELVAAMERL